MRNRGKIYIAFTSLVVAGLLLTVLANIWKSNLIVKHVIVTGNRIVETNEIHQLAHVTTGAKLYDLDLMVIQRDVASHHFLKQVMVERDLPSTLRIHVIERTPLAMIARSDILYVDSEGFVLPHSISRELFDLPVLSGIPSDVRLSAGTQMQLGDVREALHTLSTAKLVSKDLYYLISEVRVRNGGDILLYATEWGVPIIFGRGNAVRKLTYLELFWKEIVHQRGSQNLQYIDLRFEDQVVARWNGGRSTS